MDLHRPDNIFQETWLLLFMTKVLGLSPIQHCRVKIVSYLYTVIFLTLYYSSFCCIIQYACALFDDLAMVTGTAKLRKIGFYLNVPYIAIMILPSILHSHNVILVYEEINDIDKSFKFLNTHFNYKSRMMQNIVHTVGVMLATILFNLVDYYSLLDRSSDYRYLIMWILSGLPELVNTMVLCSLVVLSVNIELRCTKTIQIVSLLTEEKTATSNTSSGINEVSRLKLLLTQYMKLCNITKVVSQAYGLQIVISYIIYFLRTCVHLYIVYAYFGEVNDFVDVLTYGLWVCFDICKFAYVFGKHAYIPRNCITM